MAQLMFLLQSGSPAPLAHLVSELLCSNPTSAASLPVDLLCGHSCHLLLHSQLMFFYSSPEDLKGGTCTHRACSCPHFFLHMPTLLFLFKGDFVFISHPWKSLSKFNLWNQLVKWFTVPIMHMTIQLKYVEKNKAFELFFYPEK